MAAKITIKRNDGTTDSFKNNEILMWKNPEVLLCEYDESEEPALDLYLITVRMEEILIGRFETREKIEEIKQKIYTANNDLEIFTSVD